MNDQNLDKKVRKDAVKVKNDLSVLVGDSSARINKLEDDVSQAAGLARDGIATWIDDGVSQLSDGFGKMTDDARETVVSAAATARKDVSRGLGQYNTNVQRAADRVPGGFSKQVADYPWVAMSVALAVGFLLGSMHNPGRQFHG